ncbi:hypothetical protein [Kitasatospora sp. GP82]|uniref:hypothetical protein n=1 Tax=Kitasatospora sp. GP82 TaxID=3035089 RepID=UPI002476A603|nr:hypothetical protein [Kitasatospora sp. GP82]MDH6125706.1 hypothetical protein [Kitasatospora sp. GP82]
MGTTVEEVGDGGQARRLEGAGGHGAAGGCGQGTHGGRLGNDGGPAAEVEGVLGGVVARRPGAVRGVHQSRAAVGRAGRCIGCAGGVEGGPAGMQAPGIGDGPGNGRGDGPEGSLGTGADRQLSAVPGRLKVGQRRLGRSAGRRHGLGRGVYPEPRSRVRGELRPGAASGPRQPQDADARGAVRGREHPRDQLPVVAGSEAQTHPVA